MCALCAAGSSQAQTRRTHVLQLLALIEHPDALPANAALRLGRELLALTRPDAAGRRCDPVLPPAPEIAETA